MNKNKEFIEKLTWDLEIILKLTKISHFFLVLKKYLKLIKNINFNPSFIWLFKALN